LRNAKEDVMSVGIGTISKGLLQQAIEKVANDPQRRPDFLNALQGPQMPTDWLAFLTDSRELDSAAESYVRNTWQKFWVQYPVEVIMRQSLIEAIQLATRDPVNGQERFLPIDCYWIWTNDSTKFEVLLTYNERQVTRILLTPPPPTNPNRSILTGLTPFWIVKANPVEQAVRTDPEGQWITVQIKAPA
jgi:hypothetical protein